MSELELNQRLIHFKHKLNMHLMERNSNNLNESYMEFLERNMEEIKAKLNELKAIERKAA